MGESEPVCQTEVTPVGVTSSTRIGQIKNRLFLQALCLLILSMGRL